MKKKDRNQLTLFSEIVEKKTGEWIEVPQDVFLSWPEKQQLEYCMRRDEHAAEVTDFNAYDDEQRAWFLNRAQMYKEILNCLCQ